MKRNILLFVSLSLVLGTATVLASDFQEHTAACRLEIKIMGPDLLDEDKDCIWVEQHKAEIMAECKECMADFALIKEAAKGYFSY